MEFDNNCNIIKRSGNWTSVDNNLINPIQIITNWNYDTGSPSHKKNPTKDTFTTSPFLKALSRVTLQFLFEVCYSPSVTEADFVQVLVPYTAGYDKTFPKNLW